MKSKYESSAIADTRRMRPERSVLTRREVFRVILGAVASTGVAPLLGDDAKASKTPILDEFDKLAVGQQLPWIMKAMEERPRPLFAELRAHRPVLSVGDVVLIARYTDVLEALRHPTIFSVRLYKPKMGNFLMTHDETQTHRRDKAVMTAMLPRDDEKRIRDSITDFCEKAINASQGRIDIVDSLTRAAPVHLVQTYFGLDGVEPNRLREWSFWSQYDNFHNHPFQARSNSQEISKRAAQAKQELAGYATSLIQRRVGELAQDPTRDDIVSRMLKSRLPPSLGFGPEQLVLNTMGLLIGAVETTSHATVHAVNALLELPQELAAAADSARQNDFEKLSQYVWEASRFQPLAPYIFRFCERDFAIAKGTDRSTNIRQGATVLLLTQSAMFDEVEFKEPTKFDHGRPSYQSFLFGFGNHRCLGEFVGSQMIPAIIGSLLRKPNLRRASGSAGKIDFKGGPFPESLILQFDT